MPIKMRNRIIGIYKKQTLMIFLFVFGFMLFIHSFSKIIGFQVNNNVNTQNKE